jgi:hypothetical protein
MKNYLKGKIDEKLIGDYSTIEYSQRRQFPDDATVNKWKSLGHLYVNYTGFLREEYKGLPEWCYNIKSNIETELNISDGAMCLYCMSPGTIMPEHKDTYPKYKELHNIKDLGKICRVLIFLSDWKSGHYFEVDDHPIVDWKRGDYCMWFGDTPHIAANIGRENRYTLQITAKVK